MEIVENFLKSKDYLNCISYLRNNTKNFNLIDFICKSIENNNKIEKNYIFWDDYAISNYYLGNIHKSYNLYNNIFNYEITNLSENEINHCINNLNFSISNNMKKNQDNIISLENQIGSEFISFINLTDEIKKNIKENYNPMNPSIIYNENTNEYLVNIRTVNYKLSDNFCYLGNGNYNTINYLIKYDNNFNIKNIELKNNVDMPYKHNFYGCEDIRIFYYKNKLHFSFTSLSVKENKIQYICLGNSEENNYVVLDGYGNGKIQKNWTPIVVDNTEILYFIYSFFPLIVLKYDEDIKNVKLHQCSMPGTYNKWRGGTPAISLEKIGLKDFYLCVIHESNFPKYVQKFVLLKYNNNIFEIYNYSPLFYFYNETIEFCSGITINKENLILSFGKLDRETHIAKVNLNKIIQALLNPKQKIIQNPNFINDNEKYENINSPYTFITCFFNLEKHENKERIRKFDFYKEKCQFIMNLDINIVIYIDDDNMIEHIKNIRKKYMQKTKIIKISIEELPYYKYYDEIKNNRELNNYAGFCDKKDTPLFTIIMWSKMYFLENTIKNNYFNTNYFMWIDFGVSYVANTENYLNSFIEPSEKISILSINIPNGKNINNINNLNRWDCYLGGGVFCGNKENMLNLIKLFNYNLSIFIQNKICPLEDIVISYIAYTNRDLFEFYYGDYEDIINNRNFMFSDKYKYLIFRNIDICLNENMYDEIRLMIKYVLKSFNNNYINLSDDEFNKIMDYNNKIFYK